MKLCPAPMARAFSLAKSIMAESVPVQRTRHLPEASQKARPNLMPGTAPTRASWMSSTDLMKWVWPRMKLVSSGFSILTVISCMMHPLFPVCQRWLPGGDEHPFRAGRREVDGPAMNAGVHKTGLAKHLQKRPAPHSPDDYVRDR